MNESKNQPSGLVEKWQLSLVRRFKFLQTYPEGDMHWGYTKIVLGLFWSWVFLTVAILFLIISFLFDAFALDGWTLFQRSGAVLVAAGSYIQFREIKFPKLKPEVDAPMIDPKVPGELFLRWSYFFNRLSWFSIILGTFVWAYGDWVVS